ncbi:hypothetical protein DBR12_11895 [Acidovorax sp. HMWF029]|nr:hypothetical protein DBR12_11895 [Acidovorax sp. HMWF029]
MACSVTRACNTAGQLTATEFSSYQYNSAGRITSLTQNLWKPGSTNPLQSTLARADTTWTVQYDTLGRITQMGDNVRTTTYQYDASHNRLLGFKQTATSATGNSASTSTSTSVTYQYNSAGDLLGDGLTTYRYDSEGRMESSSTGQGEDAPTTKYAHNGLGQRVFKTEPLYASTSTGNKTGKTSTTCWPTTTNRRASRPASSSKS